MYSGVFVSRRRYLTTVKSTSTAVMCFVELLLTSPFIHPNVTGGFDVDLFKPPLSCLCLCQAVASILIKLVFSTISQHP